MNTFVPYSNEDPEALFICPYQNVHVVRACRFNQHLRKCRRNHGGEGFEICSFNQSHHVPIKLFEKHMRMCPDRHVIAQDLAQAQGLQKHVLPPIDHNPVWHNPPSTEDWDTEFEEHQQLQIAQNIPPEVEENDDDENSILKKTTLLRESPPNWDQMTAVQKKNYRRRYNKQLQRMAEQGLTEADFEKSKNPEDWTDQERDDKINAILSLYPPPTGKIRSEFVDFKSVLNQYCQSNKINPPKYNEISTSTRFGGFSYEAVVQGKQYTSHGNMKTKKEAAHNASYWALLALEIAEETPFSKPRAPRSIQDTQNLRDAHETGLLHRAGQLQTTKTSASIARPSYAASSGLAFSSGSAATTTPAAASIQASNQPSGAFSKPQERIENSMQGLSINDNHVQHDGWSTVGNKKNVKQGGRGRGRGTALVTF